MNVRYENPEKHHTPASSYSHVSIVETSGLAFVAGQIPIDENGDLVGADDMEAQVRQVYRNLMNVVASVGASPSDIAELRTFLVGETQIAEFRKAREEAFTTYFPDGRYPPNTLLVVSALASPAIMIEVSAVVALPR